jgi:hypothetical protein
MPLVGYRNLEWLKARLLPAEMGDESSYDADLSDIGRGVAALFDRTTGRLLRRTVGAVYNCAADADSVVVPCYPIETITSVYLVDATGSTLITGQVESHNASAGIIHFAGAPGSDRQTLSITVTGGYWCDDAVAAMPNGATPLPDDLVNAWVQQCRAVAEAENIFRAKGAEKPDKKSTAMTLETLALLPGVKAMLQLYRRYS